MKLNQEQQGFIKTILHRVLKFRETYEELYDHVLTALEATPDNIPFSGALHNIIENELGGAKGIRSIQAKHTNLAIREFILDYFRCAIKSLTSLSLLLISISTVLFYVLTKQPWFNEQIRGIYAWRQLFGPVLMYVINAMVRRNKTGLKLTPLIGHLKSDIRGYFTVFMGFLPYFLWAIPDLIYRKFNYQHLPIGVSILLFFIMVLHIVTCYKLYSAPNTQPKPYHIINQ